MNRIILFLSFLAIACLTGCYRMPSENEYSLVPMTNNPDVTRESSSWSPNFNY